MDSHRRIEAFPVLLCSQGTLGVPESTSEACTVAFFEHKRRAQDNSKKIKGLTELVLTARTEHKPEVLMLSLEREKRRAQAFCSFAPLRTRENNRALTQKVSFQSVILRDLPATKPSLANLSASTGLRTPRPK